MFSAATKTGSQPSAANYIEDVFSTFLYTGNGSTRNITNGIDLASKSGMVWIKSRSSTTNNFLFDTIRGTLNEINSNTTDAQASLANSLTAFNSNGFSLGSATGINVNAATYCSWTFRKQAKFFDIVTYTGNGAARTIAHNLGSAPGMIIVKCTSVLENWAVYHRSLGATKYIRLNTTGAEATSSGYWNNTEPTSSVFTINTDGEVNTSGETYVAYLFAHDAGGFGTSGTDNVISCGSYTGTGTTGNFVSLGYEPQYILIKRATGGTGNWTAQDVMRYMSETGSAALYPNAAFVEDPVGSYVTPNATGFTIKTGNIAWNVSGDTYIYMAIRRPMKVPTDATTVFEPTTGNFVENTSNPAVSSITADIYFEGYPSSGSLGKRFWNRLQGSGYRLDSTSTAVEAFDASSAYFDVQTGVRFGGNWIGTALNIVRYFFKRAPNFMDVVCYTGQNISNQRVNHNLTIPPELIIFKSRSGVSSWYVYAASQGISKFASLNTTDAFDTFTNAFGDTAPTATDFGIKSNSFGTPYSSGNVVAYLFATCAGVSKVGSYTGNGGTQAIACGFTGGARFVLIKRTDDTGDWYVYDTARGMTVLTNPYIELNTTDAQVATLGSVTTTTGGFTVNASILAAINTNAASYIFLAIA